MYVDKQCLLSDAQDLSQDAGNFYSTNTYNLGHTKDPGTGNPLYVVICVDEAFTSAGSATVKFVVIDEADTTLDDSSVEIIATRAIAYTTLTAGKVIVIPIPAGLITQQYIGLKYVIGTATTTAGTVTAFVALQPPLHA